MCCQWQHRLPLHAYAVCHRKSFNACGKRWQAAEQHMAAQPGCMAGQVLPSASSATLLLGASKHKKQVTISTSLHPARRSRSHITRLHQPKHGEVQNPDDANHGCAGPAASLCTD
jgi:hypothetical protein